MKTKVVNTIKKGNNYYYELEDTLFFVEGGGQMKDVGTINGIELISCFENQGHIYHQLAKPLDRDEVKLVVDEKHRYISCQGHTAQHLLSAAFYALYQISTVSHHYNLQGSYIDLDSDDVSEKMLEEAQEWVNERIREHREIEILYPTQEEFEKMPVHHLLKVDKDIRIVHIQGVEYNPCKGMHVNNTSEVQLVEIIGTEKVKGNVRIHYMFGEVARNHFHLYQQQLKKVSVEVSKPMEESYQGVLKVIEGKEQLEKQLAILQNQYIELYIQPFLDKRMIIHESDLDQDLLNKLCLKLTEVNVGVVYLFNKQQIITIAGKDASMDAKMMFDELKEKFNLRGGGNKKISRGVCQCKEEIIKYVKSLNNI